MTDACTRILERYRASLEITGGPTPGIDDLVTLFRNSLVDLGVNVDDEATLYIITAVAARLGDISHSFTVAHGLSPYEGVFTAYAMLTHFVAGRIEELISVMRFRDEL